MPRKIPNRELHRLTPQEFRHSHRTPVALVLDNIRSQHNVGAAFRTADAFALEKIYLCGITGCPPSADIHKSALGAEDTVDWQYTAQTDQALEELRAQGYRLIAVEQAEGAQSLEDFCPEPTEKVALIFGNEVKGVQQSVVDAADSCLEIPQFGTKHSLNVSVSIGVVLWQYMQRYLKP